MQRILRAEWFPLVIISVALLVVVFFNLPAYTASWDELRLYSYGRQSLDAYRTLFNSGSRYFGEDDLRYYGPAYLLMADRVVSSLQWMKLVSNGLDGWHLVNFSIFVAGLWSLYYLSRRWLNYEASLAMVLLFVTQPVLWGHALINPKDIPFCTGFTTAIYFGLRFSDSLLKTPSTRSLSPTSDIGHSSVSGLGSQLAAIFQNKYLWLASISLGILVSIRIMGLIAGVLIGLYVLWKHGTKVLLILEMYILFALTVMVATWPFLWDAPIANFGTALHVMAAFPWNGDVLFDGTYYPPAELPGRYLPTLLALQLTEPLLVLIVLGLMVLIYHLFRTFAYSDFLFVFLFWFLLPFGWGLTGRARLYDNFRQMLFILPSLFILAGFGLEKLFAMLKSKGLKTLALMVFLLPSIFGLISSHPYEYMYYNSIVGGINGAFRRFETDYWGLSTREAAQYINQNAPQNSAVVVYGPLLVSQRYLRTDLVMYSYNDLPPASLNHYYVLILARWNMDQTLYKDSPVIYYVQKDQAVLTVVKEVSK